LNGHKVNKDKMQVNDVGKEMGLDPEQEVSVKDISDGAENQHSTMNIESVESKKSDNDSQQPKFPKLSALLANGNRSEYRRVRCPSHRYTPLREHWEQILTPLVEYLKLQVRTIGVVSAKV
jgi:hypothetical protein